MYIKRKLSEKLSALAKGFPAIALLGPRQSGKTTLAKNVFPEYEYYSFEDLDIRILAANDPRAFLEKCQTAKGVILDEIQNVPTLFSYLQTNIDLNKKMGHFILTGSQNFALTESISQSLAGRIAILTLLPLSIAEIKEARLLPDNIDNAIFNGMYPAIYSNNVSPLDWYKSYINTYVERDVRQIKNITDLSAFQSFLKLCAGRVGQVLSLTTLSNDSGLSITTVKQWLSILEASYIIFLFRPFYKNLNKRVIKSSKLFFYDTGILCNLLSIVKTEQLFSHYLKGNIFESFIISDLVKQRYNKGLDPNLYFWRDQSDFEVDCIVEEAEKIIAVEIKSSQTHNPHVFDYLAKWNKIANTDLASNILIYTGSLQINTKDGKLINWKDAGNLLEHL